MKVIQIPVNPFVMNCYIYFDEQSSDGIIIDPAAFGKDEEKNIQNIVEKNRIKIKYILNTHGHLDHILGNKFAKEYFNVPVLMHKADEFMLTNAEKQAALYGIEIGPQPGIDENLTENTLMKFGNTELRVLHTPGHSPGSVCIIDEGTKNIFCGDLIFKNSIGRTDLPGGDYNVLMSSIKDKLFMKYPDGYNLFPGHMEVTNIADEKKFNPFLNEHMS